MKHGTYTCYIYYKCRCVPCKEASKAYKAAYRDEHRKNENQRSAQYRKTHRQEIKTQRALARQKKRKELRAANKAYRQTLKGQAARRKSEANRRARKRNAFIEYVDPQLVYDAHKGICGICGYKINADEYHLTILFP